MTDLQWLSSKVIMQSHPIPKLNGMGPRLGNGISPFSVLFLRGGV